MVLFAVMVAWLVCFVLVIGAFVVSASHDGRATRVAARAPRLTGRVYPVIVGPGATRLGDLSAAARLAVRVAP